MTDLSKYSRDKGARAERLLANLLKEYGYDTRRGGAMHTSGRESPDVMGLPGIHIECKDVEHLNVRNALDQSIRDAKEDEIPVVMHKKNYCPWLVTLKLEDFMEIYREWEAGNWLMDHSETTK